MVDPTTELEGEQVDKRQAGSSTSQLVERFLELLAEKELDAAAELLAADVEYVNVGLPAIYGRKRVKRVMQATLGRSGAGFEVYMHAISTSGATVLTERTDVLIFRRLRVQFWVCGRFDIEDGQIKLWRDYFGQVNFMAATLRGVLGVLVPAVRAKPPSA